MVANEGKICKQWNGRSVLFQIVPNLSTDPGKHVSCMVCKALGKVMNPITASGSNNGSQCPMLRLHTLLSVNAETNIIRSLHFVCYKRARVE